MIFPQRLKQRRLMFGLTQKMVAETLGISERAYRNYEIGRNEPSIEYLIKLADLFHVSIDYLVGHDLPEQSLVDSE